MRIKEILKELTFDRNTFEYFFTNKRLDIFSIIHWKNENDNYKKCMMINNVKIVLSNLKIVN